MIISVPQHKWLWSDIDKQSFHFRRYEKRELHERIEGVGLEIVYSTSFVSLLLPLMFQSRRRKGESPELDAGRELRLGRATNASLRTVMGIRPDSRLEPVGPLTFEPASTVIERMTGPAPAPAPGGPPAPGGSPEVQPTPTAPSPSTSSGDSLSGSGR